MARLLRAIEWNQRHFQRDWNEKWQLVFREWFNLIVNWLVAGAFWSRVQLRPASGFYCSSWRQMEQHSSRSRSRWGPLSLWKRRPDFYVVPGINSADVNCLLPVNWQWRCKLATWGGPAPDHQIGTKMRNETGPNGPRHKEINEDRAVTTITVADVAHLTAILPPNRFLLLLLLLLSFTSVSNHSSVYPWKWSHLNQFPIKTFLTNEQRFLLHEDSPLIQT